MTSLKLQFKILASAGVFLFSTAQTSAQQQDQLEHLLNNVDTPSTWAKTPISGAPSTQKIYNPPNPASVFNQPTNVNIAPQPLFTRQQILRTLLGGSPQPNTQAGNKTNWGGSNAYSDWQEAENQASRAHNARERAHYEKDKGNRESDASEAYYAANASGEASDRVYQASLNGDSTAKQYASQARAAADRARADSDQARYFADTYNP